MSVVTKNSFERASKLKMSELVNLPVSEVESVVLEFTDSEIKHILGHDPWLKNYILSIWEKVNGKTVLETYPWDLLISVVDFCNAKCGFCTHWLKKGGLLSLDDLPKFDTLFSHAKILTLTGGEPTAHPNFVELIQHIAKKINPHCQLCFITNGSRVDRYYDQIKDINIAVQFSLNAASAETHHQVMKLGPDAFLRITDSIRFLRSLNKNVSASLVVTNQNLAEVPAFIELCHNLDVNYIHLATIDPSTISYQMPDKSDSYLPPYQHPEFHKLVVAAQKAIERSTIKIFAAPNQWGIKVPSIAGQSPVEMKDLIDHFRMNHKKPIMTRGEPVSDEELRVDPGLVDMGDPYNRVAPFSCTWVYYYCVFLSSNLAMLPCCFMDKIPGYEKIGFLASEDFFELWNSPAYVALRRSLQEGPLYPKCKVCTYPVKPDH